MKPLTNILVATDFSNACNAAIDIAIELCKQHGATMHLIHVNESNHILAAPELPEIVSEIINDIDHDARARLYEMYESILREDEITVQIHLPAGIPFEEICVSASEMPIDLIIAGTHGTAGESSMAIGTTAYNIIKYATKPVLLIPASFKKGAFKNILFPIRPSQNLSAKYELVESIWGDTSSHVHIGVFALPREGDKTASNNAQLQEVMALMQNSNLACTSEFYTSKNLAEKVIEVSSLLCMDLVVISSTLDYKYAQFCMSAYTRRVINNSKVPVLSLRNTINNIDEQQDEELMEQKQTQFAAPYYK